MKYTSREELTKAIQHTLELFDAEFNDITEESKNIRIKNVSKTPSEMLSYQIGWTTLLNQWIEDEAAGKTVITPTEEFSWNQLSALYQTFYKQYGKETLVEQRARLADLVERIIAHINNMSDDEFFSPEAFHWTVTDANWPAYKWIHINTVAPFKGFSPQLRKWKKSLQ